MENVTLFPEPTLPATRDVVVLSCPNLLHFDVAPISRLFSSKPQDEAEEIVCRMLEDIAHRLDAMQRAVAGRNLSEIDRPARRVEMVAERIGLMEVAVAAGHVRICVAQEDGVALEATMARLERGFDVAVSEIWNFRDL